MARGLLSWREAEERGAGAGCGHSGWSGLAARAGLGALLTGLGQRTRSGDARVRDSLL